jgi:hypothetical protein
MFEVVLDCRYDEFSDSLVVAVSRKSPYFEIKLVVLSGWRERVVAVGTDGLGLRVGVLWGCWGFVRLL